MYSFLTEVGSVTTFYYVFGLNIFYFFKFTHTMYKFKYKWIGLKA